MLMISQFLSLDLTLKIVRPISSPHIYKMKFAAISCLSLLWAISGLRAQPEPALANGIAAIVNDVVITYEEVRRSVEPALELLLKQYETQPHLLQQKVRDLEKERIEQLIAHQLILHDFTNSGYNLPESVLDDQIQARIREDFGDRLTLTKTLQAQGVTFERFRKNVREDIIIRALTDKHVKEELIISPYKIENYYQTNQSKFQLEDQVKLRMIVLNKSKDKPEATRQLAEEIKGKLDSGAPFAEMAAIYSDGSQKTQGGDWGWVDQSVLNPELSKVAFSLQPGKQGEIVETPTACFLMLVEEKRAAHVRPLSEVRDEIEKLLIAQERARLQKQWIDRLRAKSFVRYF